MKRGFDIELGPPGIEKAPLSELASLGEQRLLDYGIFRKAGASILYKSKWKKAKVNVDSFQGRDDLKKFPFISGEDILRTQRDHSLRKFLCSHAYIWYASSSQGETRKWIPYGERDILFYMGLLLRLGRVCGFRQNDLVLSVPPLAPRVTQALPYLLMHADGLRKEWALEFITASMYMLDKNNWLEFALRKQPSVLLAQPRDMLNLAQPLAEAAGRPRTKPRELLKSLRKGIFFGQPLSPLRRELEDLFGLEAYDCYLSAEFPGLAVECHAHDGMHTWMDVCLPELIPQAELERERTDKKFVPDSVFLDLAAPGLEGEFVLTSFGECLPLVRYRTGDRVRIASVSPCACGVTHPRIVFLDKYR